MFQILSSGNVSFFSFSELKCSVSGAPSIYSIITYSVFAIHKIKKVSHAQYVQSVSEKCTLKTYLPNLQGCKIYQKIWFTCTKFITPWHILHRFFFKICVFREANLFLPSRPILKMAYAQNKLLFTTLDFLFRGEGGGGLVST